MPADVFRVPLYTDQSHSLTTLGAGRAEALLGLVHTNLKSNGTTPVLDTLGKISQTKGPPRIAALSPSNNSL